MSSGKDGVELVEVQAKPFECRMCGHTEYTVVTEGAGISAQGGTTMIVGYECKGCSFVFDSVEEFSNK